MSDLDGIGEVVTGGMLARAVEPDAGEADPGHTHEQCCLNCGILLAGPYCHACGQKAHVHRSLRAFFGDMVAGLFNFEGKIWRTLPMLAWKPGEMTRRYIGGERARYVSPVALYLFTVFLMFAVLNFTGALGDNIVDSNVDDALAKEQAVMTQLERQRADLALKKADLAQLDAKIAEHRKDLETLQNLSEGKVVATGDMDDPETPAWLKSVVLKAQADPKGSVLKIQDAASKYSWLLIPISVPFLWMLFPFYRRYRLYDHTVFVTYSLSFMMMLVILSGLLVSIGWTALAGFLFFVPPIHMYRQLRGAYQLGWFSALVRTILLTTFAFIAAGLFAAAMVAIGVF